MNKLIIYVRVSSSEQLRGTSLEVQERICRDFAKNNEYEVTKVFVEEGESAKTANRTALKELMDYVAKNYKNFHAVLVYKIDRLARNTLDHAQLKLMFNKYGLKFLSATENLEDTPVGRLIENQLAGFAQFDNEIRTERSRNGMIEAVKLGRYVWKAPLGYINTGGRGTSNLAHDETKLTRKVHLIWEYIDTGCEIEEARKKLEKEEDLKISKSAFNRMLRNKVYMGVIEKFGLSKVGDFKPLIEPELFIRVLNKIDRKARKMPIYRVNNPDFPLRQFIKHKVCGYPFYGGYATGNGGKYPHYRCGRCKNTNLKRDEVEMKYLEYLEGYRYKDEMKGALLLAIEANLTHRHEVNLKKQSDIDKAIIMEKSKMRQIMEKNFKGVCSDNLAKEMNSESEQKITDLTLQLHSFEINKDEIMDIAEKSISVLEHIGEVWLKAELDIKQRFQKFLFPDGLYYDGMNFGTTKLALCIEPNVALAYQKYPMVTPTFNGLNQF